MAKRFIDADDFLDLFYVASMGQDKAFVKTVEQVVDDTPTADVVEVVRCKDCEHYYDGMCYVSNRSPRFKYDVNIHSRKNNDFCSYGERRKDDDV